MNETCCDSKHCYGKYSMNMTEGTYILQRVKISLMFLPVSKCWYEAPEAQIAGSWGRTFWRIFSQPFQLSEENVKPGPAGHSATIILYSQTAGTLTIQWHPLLWARLFHTESQLPKYALATMWKDHRYYTFLWSPNGYSEGISLPKLVPEMHVTPGQAISFSFSETRLVNGDKEPPTSGTEFNTVYVEKGMFGSLQLASSLRDSLHTHVTIQDLCFELSKKPNKTKTKQKTWKCLYNKVSIYILCKANEVFVVGVDVRNLDINQQQHLLRETDQKKDG